MWNRFRCFVGWHVGPNRILGRGWYLGWWDRYYMEFYKCESCKRTHMEEVK